MIVAIVHVDTIWEMHKFKCTKALESWWENNKHLPGEFYTVNCTVPTILDSTTVVHDIHRFGQKWCPWCGAARRFDFSDEHRVHRCRVCHVSENEYWVRKTNGEN